MNRDLIKENPILDDISKEKEVVWINPKKVDYETSMKNSELTMADIDDAESRLERFAPFIMKCFPETKPRNGIIESELVAIPKMQKQIKRSFKIFKLYSIFICF